MSRRDLAILLLVAALALGAGLGRMGLIDPDEPFYAQTATEMLARHDAVSPYIFGHPQFEKPILFYWLTMGSFATFGRTELAGRLPGFVFGVALALMTGIFAARAFGRRAGLLTGIVLATGIAYVGCARMMLTDTVFATFVCGACFALYDALEGGHEGGGTRAAPWIAAAIFAGLAVLTKGPLGALIPALAILAHAIWTRRVPRVSGGVLLLATIVFLVIAVPWYLMMVQRYGTEYLRAFFLHENLDRLLHAEHRSNNVVWYYPLVLTIGLVPWLPGLTAMLVRRRDLLRASPAARFCFGWILSSLVFFTIAASKLPTYILFLFVPLAVLVGAALDQLLREGFRHRRERAGMIVLAFFQAAVLLAAAAIPMLRDLVLALGAMGGALAIAAILMWRRPGPAWITATASATVLLVVGATVFARDALDAKLSTRPVARALADASRAGTPVLSTAFLVRGVQYYSGRGAYVLSNRAQPFFTPHPLPIVLGASGVAEFVQRHGPALCVARDKEWREIERKAATPIAGDSTAVGDKLIVRVPPG